MGDSGQQIDQIKRAITDLVAELHARKLAIPAGVLLLAILAAMFVLPKSSTPPPPAPATTVATDEQPEQAVQVSLKMVGVTDLDDTEPLNVSSDPFEGKYGSQCRELGNHDPKQFECQVADLRLRVICPATKKGETGTTQTQGICASGSGGATGATGTADSGASGSTGAPEGDTGTGGGGTGDNGSTKKKKSTSKSYYYVATVTIDGKTYKNVTAGDTLPSKANGLALYAGTNDSNNRAIFIANDGVTISGVDFDAQLGSFQLAKGKSATLTDALGVSHKLTLKSLTKVTK